MHHMVLMAVTVHQIWYALPLLVSVSLVYAATRHEHTKPILQHALRTGVLIGGLMAVIFAILLWMSWQVS